MPPVHFNATPIEIVHGVECRPSPAHRVPQEREVACPAGGGMMGRVAPRPPMCPDAAGFHGTD